MTPYPLAWRMLPETSLNDGTSLLDPAGLHDPPSDFVHIPVEGGRDVDNWVATVSDQAHAALAKTRLVSGCSV